MQKIDVKVTDAKLWKNKHKGRNGEFYTYSISVGRKQQDGTWKNKSMRVFSKNVPDAVPSGAMCDIDGFLTLDSYPGKDGDVDNIALYATTIKFHGEITGDESMDDLDSFEALDDDIPF